MHYYGSVDDANEVVRRIQDAGGDAVALSANLIEAGAAENLMENAVEALGPLTCLINNASTFESDTVLTATRASWDGHMEVNLRAPFELTQAFVRQLPEKIAGNVINIIDQRVWNLTPDFTTYTLSKAGLWGLTQILARALAPQVRVNGIGPGPTLPSVHQSDEEFAEEWSAMPLKRHVTPDDVAAAVRFILDAPTMTGQMIAIDAGQHMGGLSPTVEYPARKE